MNIWASLDTERYYSSNVFVDLILSRPMYLHTYMGMAQDTSKLLLSVEVQASLRLGCVVEYW
jgi:hypothetical protein